MSFCRGSTVRSQVLPAIYLFVRLSTLCSYARQCTICLRTRSITVPSELFPFYHLRTFTVFLTSATLSLCRADISILIHPDITPSLYGHLALLYIL
jgi:hypothetical protein